MHTARDSVVAPAAAITARDLIGGLVVAVGLGALADTLPLPLVVRRVVDGIVALSVVVFAGGIWGRDMATLAGFYDARRVGKLTAWSLGPAIIAVGALLSALEPSVVDRATRAGFQIHVVYTVLFVPATALVAAAGGFALGSGLDGRRRSIRLATVAALAAAAAFLAVDLVMYSLGWRVGAPNAGRRATMLVVTVLSASAAAVAAGAAIGTRLHRPIAPIAAPSSG